MLPSESMSVISNYLSVFLLATIAVVLSHVPGGVGVFELVILTMLGVEADKELSQHWSPFELSTTSSL